LLDYYQVFKVILLITNKFAIGRFKWKLAGERVPQAAGRAGLRSC
jgi:hypothetical protein